MRRVVQFALASRLVVILLQIIFNLCVPDHDADAFRTPAVEDTGWGDHAVSSLFGGFQKWDAQYFLHIAQFGYTYENTLAFFPLFPLFLKSTFYILSPLLLYIMNTHSCLLVIGVAMNIVFFILSTVYLNRLTMQVFKNKSMAYLSALLFCLNPASIFFSSLYSESLFSALTFAGLFYLEEQNQYLSLVFLSLSASARSNGILSLGFVIHSEFRSFFRKHSNHKACSFSSSCFFSVVVALRLMFKVVIFFIPFLIYQAYSFILFCHSHVSSNDLHIAVVQLAEKQGYKIYDDSPSEWCTWKIPVSYSYVQSHYWNVGFLQYYEIKQIPNFLLAFPLLFIIVSATVSYCWKNAKLVSSLGLMKSSKQRFHNLYENDRCFVYFAHAGVLVVISIFFIHIQVSTRLFASSSPVLYWIAASLVTSVQKFHLGDEQVKSEENKNRVLGDLHHLYDSVKKSSTLTKLVHGYFSLYFILGVLLHVNYLPWT